MQGCSFVVLLMAVMFLNGAHPSNLGERHTRSPFKIERLDAQDRLHGNLKRSKRQVTMEEEIGEKPRLWPIGGRKISTKQLEDVCECLSSHSPSPSVCNSDMEDFGSIINGTCPDATQRRQRRYEFTELFVEGKHNPSASTTSGSLCEGTRPLVLVSSGNKRSLHLNNMPLVLVCPGSLGNSLQELIITDVVDVMIAPGSLAPRLTNFTLTVNGLYRKNGEMTFPRGALCMDAMEFRSASDVQIRVVVSNANSGIRFESKSVVAPVVSVEVRDVQNVMMETQAVQCLSPNATSSLSIYSTQTVSMETRAAVVKSLIMSNISTLSLVEESVVVMGSTGKFVLQDVSDVIAHERSITLGDLASLKVSSVSFFVNRGTNKILISTSPLRSVILRDVEVVDSHSTSICLATNKILLAGGSTAPRKETSSASACIEFSGEIEEVPHEDSGVVACHVSTKEDLDDPLICATNPRCKSCADPETLSLPTIQTSDQPTLVVKTAPTQDVKRRWWEDPFYLGLIAALVVLVLLIICSLCIYKLHRRSRRATYELPQTCRNGTFARTIITPENLNNKPPGHADTASQPAHQQANNISVTYLVPYAGSQDCKEVFVSYNAPYDPSIQQREGERSPSDPNTAWRDSRSTFRPDSSVMTPEDDHSLTSSEMTI